MPYNALDAALPLILLENIVPIVVSGLGYQTLEIRSNGCLPGHKE